MRGMLPKEQLIIIYTSIYTHLSSNYAISTIIFMTIHMHRATLALGTASFATLKQTIILLNSK